MSPLRNADTFTPSIPETLDLRGLQRCGVAKIRLESDETRTLLLQRDFLNPLILKGVAVKRVF